MNAYERHDGSRLSVEIVLPSLPRAGMEIMACELAKGLVASGHKVGVTCLEETGPLADDLRGAAVDVSLVPCPGARSNFLPHKALVEHLRSRRCDVLHMHNIWGKASLAGRYAGVLQIVATMHGLAAGEPWFYESLRWWGARYIDCVVAVSEPLRRHLIERTRIPSEKVVMLVNGIDLQRFAAAGRTGLLRTELGIAPDVPVIGCVARLDPVKNHPMLLRAFKRLLAELPAARLIIVGEGPLGSQLQADASEMDLSGRVSFVGSVADTAPVYREFDVFALGSVSEGTSISILEALASGVPVVATAVGGNPALLAPDCGLLVPSDDDARMAEAIVKVLRDRDLSDALARRGRARVASGYSSSSMISAYERLYRSLLGADGQRGVSSCAA
ncbi:glycosyltransferase [Mesorhizobium sp. BAC0120]|nr:glycosyltransferase [Mesorhizobium sp. BAC0120]